MIEAGELLAGVVGAFLAGVGKLISDARSQARARESYLSSIQAEVKCLTDLIESQELEIWLRQISHDCRTGNAPKRRPGFDFGYNYFSVFDSLGAELRFLKKAECEEVVSFYMLVKAAFDTVKLNGPMQREQDLASLEQLCLFLLSVLQRLSTHSEKIQAFSARRTIFKK